MIPRDPTRGRRSTRPSPSSPAVDPARLARFLDLLPDAQRGVAAGMVAAGWQIAAFWGPEPLDAWTLTVTRGSVRVTLGVEHGVPHAIEVAHPQLRRPRPGEGWPTFEQVWLVWARRTGIVPRAIDPRTLPTVAGFAAWAKVLAWLDSGARRADFAALDALRDVHREHALAERGDSATPLTAEERTADVEHAITASLPRRASAARPRAALRRASRVR